MDRTNPGYEEDRTYVTTLLEKIIHSTWKQPSCKNECFAVTHTWFQYFNYHSVTGYLYLPWTIISRICYSILIIITNSFLSTVICHWILHYNSALSIDIVLELHLALPVFIAIDYHIVVFQLIWQCLVQLLKPLIQSFDYWFVDFCKPFL